MFTTTRDVPHRKCRECTVYTPCTPMCLQSLCSYVQHCVWYYEYLTMCVYIHIIRLQVVTHDVVITTTTCSGRCYTCRVGTHQYWCNVIALVVFAPYSGLTYPLYRAYPRALPPSCVTTCAVLHRWLHPYHTTYVTTDHVPMTWSWPWWSPSWLGGQTCRPPRGVVRGTCNTWDDCTYGRRSLGSKPTYSAYPTCITIHVCQYSHYVCGVTHSAWCMYTHYMTCDHTMWSRYPPITSSDGRWCTTSRSGTRVCVHVCMYV